MSDPVATLMYFIDDNKLDIRLYTDASDFGIGGVLLQVVGAIWQPIAFVSKSLTPTQIRWSTIQKEAYAILYCCTQLDYLIRYRMFTIHTDHLNITYMKQNPTSMVARWFIAMQELHFTVVFVPGTSNVLADALSRLCSNLTEIALPLRTEELELLPTSSYFHCISSDGHRTSFRRSVRLHSNVPQCNCRSQRRRPYPYSVV